MPPYSKSVCAKLIRTGFHTKLTTIVAENATDIGSSLTQCRVGDTVYTRFPESCRHPYIKSTILSCAQPGDRAFVILGS